VADRRDQNLDALSAARRRLRESSVRLLLAGLLGAALVAAVGHGLIAWRLGSDEAVLARGEHDVRRTFDDAVETLQRGARRLATNPGVSGALQTRREETTRALFDEVGRIGDAVETPGFALAVFTLDGNAIAWSGPSSDIPLDRLAGPSSLFVVRGPLGLRLVYTEPVMTAPASATTGSGAGGGGSGRAGGGARGNQPRRIGAIVAEQPLSTATASTNAAERDGGFPLTTSIGPVTLRQVFAAPSAEPESSTRFTLRAPAGEALVETIVPLNAAETMRARWRRTVNTLVFAVLGVTLLLVAASCVLYRDATHVPAFRAMLTPTIIGLILVARAVFWWASTPLEWTGALAARSPGVYVSALLHNIHRSPLDLLLSVLAFTGIVLVLIDPVRRYACQRRGSRRRLSESAGALLWALAVHLFAGVLLLALELGVLLVIGDTVENASVNLLRLTLLPWNSGRYALLLALLLLQASGLWLAVLICRLAVSGWRIDLSPWWQRVLVPLAWMTPSLGALASLFLHDRGLPLAPLLLTALVAAATAYVTRRGVPWYRHGSQAMRITTLFLGLLVPAWLLYPSLVHFVDLAKRRLIETQYAVETRDHPKELLNHLYDALRQIDQVPAIGDLAQAARQANERPSTEPAFTLWRETDLNTFRLTSAVELYGPDGTLASRFALNFPENNVGTSHYVGKRCTWDLTGEAVPVGADERRLVHAERGICVPDPKTGTPRIVGAIVLYVMLDYNALRFISSQSPYFEFVRGMPSDENAPSGSDVELAIYGWGHLPIFTSSNRAWQLDDDVFRRAFQSRAPFWTVLSRGDVSDHAYVSNDRNGVYVLGYPVLTTFNHLVYLAEMTSFAAMTFVALLTGAGMVRRLHRHGPYPAELLVREFRVSFYRKLFLAFVAAVIVPVFALALLVRAYVAHQLQADVESESVRTATVARRFIEESLAQQERLGTTPASVLTDDMMVWISRVINQDVNIFEGPRLLVTSERDLFASGLLPMRTPDSVYRAIGLQRLSTYVDREEIGDFTYLMAATPVQAGPREAILTVPLASRQLETLREIDELDRGVHLGALVLILLGAAVGYWMAERIGDPVQRLTRATRRIAAGDLNTRVIVKTADELQRLVEAFNKMAGELQRQRGQLERTNRLEAWAEMARQVAHDIKNPLTPIQLSAEHLRRVHQDRGQPLSPVLDNCVDTILSQVRLLRQIASEFSSFGMSPTVNPTETSLRTLINEVVDPYRLGGAERVSFEVDVPETLPSLYVDRMLISRAVTNIIENALFAMPSGGTMTLQARAVPAAQRATGIELTIRDTGVGMDDEAARRVFEPYFSTKATGTGLGLSIARRNVELHHGTIAIRSRRGEGTSVIIVLPVTRPPADGASASTHPTEEREASATLH
jgi:signal transduction histidine kinase